MSKQERLFKDLCAIAQLAELIKIYYYNSIKDTRFRNPRIADKADKIIKFAESIQSKELSSHIKLNPATKDTMQNEHAVELWRLFEYYSFMPTPMLKEFMDGVEEIESEKSK